MLGNVFYMDHVTLSHLSWPVHSNQYRTVPSEIYRTGVHLKYLTGIHLTGMYLAGIYVRASFSRRPPPVQNLCFLLVNIHAVGLLAQLLRSYRHNVCGAYGGSRYGSPANPLYRPET